MDLLDACHHRLHGWGVSHIGRCDRRTARAQVVERIGDALGIIPRVADVWMIQNHRGTRRMKSAGHLRADAL